MKYGVVYPQIEFGVDPGAISDFAQTAEDLGYNHIVAYDHILGANPDRPGGWRGPYTYQSQFMEPFVLFSYMAGLTKRIEFTNGILILPQRQTALVAKQAATLDVLSGGRLRLGIGLGWNEVEYISLGQDFHNRGRRIEEQVEVLRSLWSQPLVNFQGRWHTIPDAGINPLPLRKDIPIWFGGAADPVLQRAAWYGDGWMPNYRSADDARSTLEKLDRFLEAAGRKRNGTADSSGRSFGLDARIPYGDGNADTWSLIIKGWEDLGATLTSFNSMGSGFSTPKEHLEAIQRFAREIGLK
jgi:probable F420-dependent oxidoreductase